jgi:Lrp/AsnC family transcriptional regulator, leucine-responsive regulatory protein
MGADRRLPGTARQAGAEDRADVEGSAASGRQGLRNGLVRGCQRHDSTIAETGSHAMANMPRDGHLRATMLRNYGGKLIFMSEHVPNRVDRAIVARLQRDGRIANVDLADAIALSPSACLRRVKALEASGLIAGYRAEVSRLKAGLGLTVFIGLKVEGQSPETASQIEQALLAIPAVVACYLVSGTNDFLVEAAVPDLASYEQLLLAQILAIPAVVEAQSTFAIRTILSRGPLPLDHWRRQAWQGPLTDG